MATSITFDGITWTFSSDKVIGYFCNGDPWVVGPITVTGISPMSVDDGTGRIVNGSMLNPAINLLQGYDSNMMGVEGRCWDASLNVARPGENVLSAENPLSFSTGSLLSAISVVTPSNALNVSRIVVLTVLASEPAVGAFRPAWVGSDKSIKHYASDIDNSCFLNLTPPSGIPTVAEVAAYFQRPWIEHMADWRKQIFCPTDNMPSYGVDICQRISDGGLMLNLDVDPTTKALLLLRMVQLGLDYYMMTQVEGGKDTWYANGGHMGGRGFPVLLAGKALNDATIINIMQKSGDYAYSGNYVAGTIPSDYIHFGEQDQTFYITQQAVDITHGNSDIPWTPDNRADPIAYEAGDIGRAEWGISHVNLPGWDNNNPRAEYRPVAAPSFSGLVLASKMMGIEPKWNHRPLFDFMDLQMALTPGQSAIETLMWSTYNGAYPYTVASDSLLVMVLK